MRRGKPSNNVPQSFFVWAAQHFSFAAKMFIASRSHHVAVHAFHRTNFNLLSISHETRRKTKNPPKNVSSETKSKALLRLLNIAINHQTDLLKKWKSYFCMNWNVKRSFSNLVFSEMFSNHRKMNLELCHSKFGFWNTINFSHWTQSKNALCACIREMTKTAADCWRFAFHFLHYCHCVCRVCASVRHKCFQSDTKIFSSLHFFSAAVAHVDEQTIIKLDLIYLDDVMPCTYDAYNDFHSCDLQRIRNRYSPLKLKALRLAHFFFIFIFLSLPFSLGMPKLWQATKKKKHQEIEWTRRGRGKKSSEIQRQSFLSRWQRQQQSFFIK